MLKTLTRESWKALLYRVELKEKELFRTENDVRFFFFSRTAHNIPRNNPTKSYTQFFSFLFQVSSCSFLRQIWMRPLEGPDIFPSAVTAAAKLCVCYAQQQDSFFFRRHNNTIKTCTKFFWVFWVSLTFPRGWIRHRWWSAPCVAGSTAERKKQKKKAEIYEWPNSDFGILEFFREVRKPQGNFFSDHLFFLFVFFSSWYFYRSATSTCTNRGCSMPYRTWEGYLYYL